MEGQGRLARRAQGGAKVRPSRSRRARRASTCCAPRPCTSTCRRCAARAPWRVETNGSPEALKRLLDRKVDAAVRVGAGRHARARDAGRDQAPEHRRDPAADHRRAGGEPHGAAAGPGDDQDAARHLLRRRAPLPRAIPTSSPATSRRKPRCRWRRSSRCSPAWPGPASPTISRCGSAPSPTPTAWSDVIRSTLRILTETGALASDPLPDQDPYRIINSNFVGAAFTATATGMTAAATAPARASTSTSASCPTPSGSALREIGTLKALNVSFQSGTADLSYDGKTEIDGMMDVLRHYPGFRIRVRGHTAQSGDPELEPAALARARGRGRALHERDLQRRPEPHQGPRHGLGAAAAAPAERVRSRVPVPPAARRSVRCSRMPFEPATHEPPKDLSPGAIKRAVLGQSLQHPSVIYPAVLGALGGDRRGGRRRLAADAGRGDRRRRRGGRRARRELFPAPRPHRGLLPRGSAQADGGAARGADRRPRGRPEGGQGQRGEPPARAHLGQDRARSRRC